MLIEPAKLYLVYAKLEGSVEFVHKWDRFVPHLLSFFSLFIKEALLLQKGLQSRFFVLFTSWSSWIVPLERSVSEVMPLAELESYFCGH